MSIKVLKKVFFFGILLFLLIILGIVSYRFDNYATFSWEARFRWEKEQAVITTLISILLIGFMKKVKRLGILF